MAHEPRTPYLVGPCGVLHIDALASGVAFFLARGSLELARFPGDSRTFLEAEDAAAWHEREHERTRGRSGNPLIARALREAVVLLARGELRGVSRSLADARRGGGGDAVGVRGCQ